MASNTHTIAVTERCRISPPPDTVAENSIPLTFFDLLWLNLSPFSRVLFYDFDGTRTDFAQDLIPKLKTSLSLALQHYFPLAANLVTPTTYNDRTCISTKPTIRCLDGDSVSLTVAEYDADFIHLTGNHSRNIEELSCLAPQLSPAVQEHSLNGGCEVQVSPVLAIQVTYFPGQGICVGFTNSHAVADGSTIFNFIKAWGLIAKSCPLNLSDDLSLQNCSELFKLPIYDRSVIKDPKGLAGIYISQRENYYSHVPPILAPAPAKKVRATFVLAQTNIEALKKLISTKLPRLPHLSSLTVAGGYIWSCLAKVKNAIDSNVEDEEEHLMLAVDCRARLDPPVPETYFGNCITSCLITTNNSQLVRERGEGFVRATELIGESIHKKLNGGILEGAEMWYEDFKVVKTKWKPERVSGIAGSPKFYFYDIDFGWGRPRKYEFVSQKLSMTRRTDVVADIEVGLCLTEDEMVSFSEIYGEGLLIPS